MGRIIVVGVGPGSADFITPAAQGAVDGADVLLGGRSALSLFPCEKPKKIIGADMDEVLDFIRENRDCDIAVLSSGDPGFYSILNLLLKNFPREDIDITPGISSMQLCFARIKDLWHDAKFVSLHGRSMEPLPSVVPGKLVILTDRTSPPNKVADFLLENEIQGRAWVCDSLSSASENVIEGTLKEITVQKFSGNCVMVFEPDAQDDSKRWGYRTPGIPDELFEKKDTPMTKAEVRALTLSKARIADDSIIYDIGAGAGSISVEAALMARRGQVFSIEKLSGRVRIIEKNIRNFGVSNVRVVRGEAPEALKDLPDADRIIIGGSSGRLNEILQKCSEKLRKRGIIVINAVTSSTLKMATLALKEQGFDFEVIQVSITRNTRNENVKLNPVSIIYTRR